VKRLSPRWTRAICGFVLSIAFLVAASAAGQLAVNPVSVSFGTVAIGDGASYTMVLSNTGDTELTISRATVSGEGFSAATPALPLTLDAGQSIGLNVTFAPQSSGAANGSLSLGYFIPTNRNHEKEDSFWNSAATVSLAGVGTTAGLTGSPPVITSAISTGGAVGSAFSYQITANNSPTSYAATGLPAGLAANSTTGLISGTPTAAGTSTVTISATNSSGTGSTNLTLTINQAAPVITSATSASGAVGSAFSYQITATNSPTSYAATGLPAGLAINTGTGLISGTPTISGTSSITIGATNASGTGSATLAVSVASTSYSVMLSWTAAPSPDAVGNEITGYNVFRSQASTGPYTQLNSTLIAGTTYADTTVADGTTYYYAVTAVDSSEAQSGYSNQAEVVIP
jgi:Putative Ig domain/Abnormal spindle-like microcephaly-assoc'd, ASPM-SPD-2-Hydin